MNPILRRLVLVGIAVLSATGLDAMGPASADPASTELDVLVTPSEREFLLSELARIEPPERIRELADYGTRQAEWGGGFYGMLPEQLAAADSIPVPLDEKSRLAAALHLARQRDVNRRALEQLNPDYPQEFQGRPLSDFLKTLPGSGANDATSGVTLGVTLDVSALRGFLEASADGPISRAEADSLAALPSNRNMLEHRRDLGYVPEPLPDHRSLASFVRMASSSDPLDRLWCWINSQNAFGYADLFQHRRDYRAFVEQLTRHGDELVQAATDRIAGFVPRDTRFQTTFAFTVGWAVRGWATSSMAGLNIEQVKDDWNFLFGTLVEETYHRLQLALIPSSTGQPARSFEDLVEIDTGDEGLDRLYEIMTYTVAEGSANFVRRPFDAADLEEKAPQGAELMSRFVQVVVEESDGEAADELIDAGLQANGPLYGLGWKMASLIANREGDRAVADWQLRGPVAFFLHAAQIAAGQGAPLVDSAVVTAVRRLESY